MRVGEVKHAELGSQPNMLYLAYTQGRLTFRSYI
jgi:hypothetical protein